MDQGSSLTVHSDSEVWLHSGRIYIDSNIDSDPRTKDRNAGSITVVTPYATIRDVGTQFEVSVSGEALEVATREGRVNVQLGENRLESGAEGGTGERLIIRSLELEERRPVSTTGEEWLWTQSSRPLFEVRDRSVADYLEWAARESGRMLVYESPIARQQAELVQLGGSGAVDADPESVRRVLSVTAFQPLTGPEYELRVGLGTR
jgi:ferric-dicitrate binding protein FerR (iron transport regulator)